MLGAIGFLLFLFITITMIYTSGLIIIIGNNITPVLASYLQSIPIIIILSLLCVLVFYSFSLIASIMIKRSSVSLFVCAMIWLFLTQIIPTTDFGWYIGALFGESENAVWDTISMICPMYMIIPIFRSNGGYNLINVILSYDYNVIALLIYVVVLIVSSYIVFLRSDVS
jgi:ABC-2 type transport system permease protein